MLRFVGTSLWSGRVLDVFSEVQVSADSVEGHSQEADKSLLKIQPTTKMLSSLSEVLIESQCINDKWV